VKRLADLSVADLRANPVWRYDGGSGADATVAPSKRSSLSQRDDEIFLAATDFELFDTSRHFGFCFPADDAGIDYLQPVIVSASGHVHFWFDGPPRAEMLAKQQSALGKEPSKTFPVTFRCLVPVDGRTVSGRIENVASPLNLSSRSPLPVLKETVFADGDPGDADRIPTARPVQPRRDTGPVEKRTAHRRRAEMKVEFTQGGVSGTGVTGDLSPRGMFVRSAQVPSTGPMLRLKVSLPEGRTLSLTGRVVRGSTTISSARVAAGFGLRLAEESPEYEDLISRLREVKASDRNS
jgi:hypothetical protein